MFGIPVFLLISLSSDRAFEASSGHLEISRFEGTEEGGKPLEDFYGDWSEPDTETQTAFATIAGAVDNAAGEGLAQMAAAWHPIDDIPPGGQAGVSGVIRGWPPG